jgi:heat-inducible transcriptional repressor
MRSILRTLETRQRLVRLLGRVLEEEGVQVLIGEDGLEPGLSRCSLVASNYRSGDRVMGSVGIVGPTRMEYVRAVALVDHLARLLTRLLTNPEAESIKA